MLGRYFNIHSGNNSAIAAWPSGEVERSLGHAAAIGADQLIQFARDHARSEDHAQPLGVDRAFA